MWRIRNAMALSTLSAGVTFVAIAGVTGTVALGVCGVVLSIAAILYQARANHNYWVTCSLHPSSATIVIEPTHPRFDDAARALYTSRRATS